MSFLVGEIHDPSHVRRGGVITEAAALLGEAAPGYPHGSRMYGLPGARVVAWGASLRRGGLDGGARC